MKNEEIRIRAYDPATDLKTLSQIWFDASLIAHAFIGEAQLRSQQVLIETQYLPSSETWVACRMDEPVGFISLLDTFVGGLFVKPGLQGFGIGRTLVEHAIGRKAELQLEVYADNLQACDFYRRLGFQELSRRERDDQGLPFENVHMVLRK
ncbi:GNAT family N-acetyltransferase [Hyphomonas sp. WL0036]|uniref:GNAT family N-acetyltransferase n=1 Tax=Hyphomonas sediminis TaxID=2866160 RepID=UPI001C7EF3F9|nr:GNAT family N-acetyltransferase [Hyphomonas sediminis]